MKTACFTLAGGFVGMAIALAAGGPAYWSANHFPAPLLIVGAMAQAGFLVAQGMKR